MYNAMGNRTIIKARVTLVFTGYGDLTLTDTALIWNKSATSFLTFGVANALTADHLMIPLSDIARVGTYTYVGGGLVITRRDGKEYKIGFKKKKEFKVVYEYLEKYLYGLER